MIDTKLSPEVRELLEKVRIARVADQLSEAAELMRQARALIDAEQRGE